MRRDVRRIIPVPSVVKSVVLCEELQLRGRDGRGRGGVQRFRKEGKGRGYGTPGKGKGWEKGEIMIRGEEGGAMFQGEGEGREKWRGYKASWKMRRGRGRASWRKEREME